MPKISFVAFPFLVLCAAMAHAQATPDCSTPEGVAAASTQIETSLQLVREDQKNREAEIDRELEARGAVKKWSKERKSQIFMSILSSAQFAAFEKEKQPYTAEIMNIALSGPPPGQKANPKEVCSGAIRLRSIVEKVKDVNARQYTFMLNEVKAAK